MPLIILMVTTVELCKLLLKVSPSLFDGQRGLLRVQLPALAEVHSGEVTTMSAGHTALEVASEKSKGPRAPRGDQALVLTRQLRWGFTTIHAILGQQNGPATSLSWY